MENKCTENLEVIYKAIYRHRALTHCQDRICHLNARSFDSCQDICLNISLPCLSKSSHTNPYEEECNNQIIVFQSREYRSRDPRKFIVLLLYLNRKERSSSGTFNTQVTAIYTQNVSKQTTCNTTEQLDHILAR